MEGRILTLVFSIVMVPLVRSGAVVIDQGNLETFKLEKEIVVLNFYADWCRYSSALKPIFDEAANQIHTESGKAIFGKVDCEAQKTLCQNIFHINKYPTIKIVRNGEVMRKEYRGKRSVDSLVQYARDQLKDPVEILPSFALIFDKIKNNMKAAIGQFYSNTSVEYSVFEKVAVSLKDDCHFFAVINADRNPMISFRENGVPDAQFTGNISQDSLKTWLSEKCRPLVREITFENGEEMTEEGLPFLILFYNPEHTEIKQVFRERVHEELSHEKGSINFVTADGFRFAHPLSHIGKAKKDLPVLAIDSFKHMYVLPNFEDIHVPGKLKAFIDDLHSGKLHRQFHGAPEPEHKHEQPRDPRDTQKQAQPPEDKPAGSNQPPESTFKKLQPAKSRYTLLHHDEL